jgi:hypothetical protein
MATSPDEFNAWVAKVKQSPEARRSRLRALAVRSQSIRHLLFIGRAGLFHTIIASTAATGRTPISRPPIGRPGISRCSVD